jgi:amino acid transporter/nucleotide-binding universal stress UspA family protein
MELPTTSHRPRNVDWKRAAALLYGDWGTSKAYVTGIAFSIAMYSSFWLVLAVSALTAVVGLNYIWICKYFPEGGGVYSSAKAQSRTLALIGGFLLVADYVVTASLSSYDAFLYLNFTFEDAKRFAILTIFIIGVINFFGPRHTGSLAILLAVATMVVVGLLAVACLPQLPAAWANVQRPTQAPRDIWVSFTGVILALSGVEAIANMTGLMQLDPGATNTKPRVNVTARRAIIPILLEVSVLTAIFGLAMHAIPGMGARDHEGDMLHYLGQVFVDQPLEHWVGLPWLAGRNIFAWVVSLVLAGLLLSAANTAIGALISIKYVMSKDGELPAVFAMLNRFGVPWILLLISILTPILVIDLQSGANALHGLAAMYGIGVVGAIGVNLGSAAFNFKLPMLRYERIIMMMTFVVIAGIEVTIAITKPWATVFAVSVLGIGFLVRAMHKGFHVPSFLATGRIGRTFFPEAATQRLAQLGEEKTRELMAAQLGPERSIGAVMVSARGVTPTLRFAVDQARANNAQLYVLFVRELFHSIPVPVIEQEDEEAQVVFQAVKSIAAGLDVVTLYAVSDDPAWTILDNAAIAGVDVLIMGHSRRTAFTRVLRGDLLERVGSQLPEEIRLVIVG